MAKKEEPTLPEKIGGCGCLLIIVLSIIVGIANPGAGLALFIAGSILVFVIASFFFTVFSKDPNMRRGGGCISVATLIIVGWVIYDQKPEYLNAFIGFSILYVIANCIASAFAAARRRKNKEVAERFKQAVEDSGVDLDNLDE